MPNATGRGLRSRRSKKSADVVVETPLEDVASEDENSYSDGEQNEDTPTNAEIQEEDTMSTYTDEYVETETDTDAVQVEASIPDFASMIEDAPEDYSPPRASAGRKREPSPFDDLLPRVKGGGYKRIPFDGTDDQAKEIKRQLQKAQHYHGFGMDSAVTEVVGDGENGVPEGETRHYVEFRVRDLQKREKSAAKAGGNGGQTALDANAESNGDLADGDTDDRDE